MSRSAQVGVASILLTAGALAVSAAGAAPALALPATCPSCGHNLILNPGAEAGPGSTDDSVVKVPHWAPKGGFTAAAYSWGGGDISATTHGPPNRGKNYFYGGPDAARSTGSQVIPVAAAGISGGKATYVVSAWLGGFSSQSDNARLYVSFENAAGVVVGSTSLGPVTEAQRAGNSELLMRSKTGAVPASTRSIAVELVMARQDGSDNDGMADNLSLVISS